MFKVGFGPYQLVVHDGPLPGMYGSYRQHAVLVEEFDVEEAGGDACMIAVTTTGDWPSLVVAQRYQGSEAGFHPGVLIVPESGVLFVGAGERLLAYNVAGPTRLWEGQTDCGFWSWQQHGAVVLLSAELELAAWTTAGKKLWSTFVEPPWSYRVENGQVHVDVMGRQSSFSLSKGPPSPSPGAVDNNWAR